MKKTKLTYGQTNFVRLAKAQLLIDLARNDFEIIGWDVADLLQIDSDLRTLINRLRAHLSENCQPER